jgi:hypothetical protein
MRRRLIRTELAINTTIISNVMTEAATAVGEAFGLTGCHLKVTPL